MSNKIWHHEDWVEVKTGGTNKNHRMFKLKDCKAIPIKCVWKYNNSATWYSSLYEGLTGTGRVVSEMEVMILLAMSREEVLQLIERRGSE